MSIKDKFSADGYNISIVAKHVTLTDAIKNYIIDKVSKIERFTSNILDVTVHVDIQKLEHKITIDMDFFHYKINVHASTKDIYSAIDKASERLISLVRKYKTKLQDHRGEHLADIDLKVNVLKPNELEDINDEIVKENEKEDMDLYKFHKVVAKEKIGIKTLTQDEAIMKLELSSDLFLIYRSEEDQKLKVMYKRKDEDFSLVEIE